MTAIVVRGSASRSVQPDRAILALGLSVVAKDPAAALDQVAVGSAELVAILDAEGVRPQDRTTDGVSVAEEWEWRNDTNTLVGYRASTAVSVVLTDLSRIAPVLREVVGTGGAQVRGLTWQVDAENPARHELLGDAARDARRRAIAYVEALGLSLGQVELISEAPIVAEPRDGAHDAAPAMAMMKSARAGAPEVAVQPGQIELRSEIHVRFGVLPG
jgi:uncharacterized protein